ncbi:MAG: DUF1467 family protein [Rubellimicrobium sp.]|nr:DUF1467 family protein [Rubellimicrobium sp.]
MSITAMIIVFAVIWFLVFLVILPLRLTTQAEAGEVVPGTPQSAPAEARVGRKAALTTAIAAGLWVLAVVVITSGWIGVRDFDWLNVMEHRRLGQ